MSQSKLLRLFVLCKIVHRAAGENPPLDGLTFWLFTYYWEVPAAYKILHKVIDRIHHPAVP
ncbi:MAG: hypothetical protein KME19_01315 [Microcoleus vaginatus WJT46-NPBG5]|nr:hypothetical protein [Microcoleus vaginatus WJT46-NPBG5]